MMTINPNLQAFLAVSETGTVSSAARQIGLTQTGVTQRIKILEQDLNCTLFLRSRKGMALTDEGQSLYRYCLQIQGMEGQLLSNIQNNGEEKEVKLKIAGPSAVIGERLISQCSQLYKKWPKLSLSFEFLEQNRRLNALKNGQVDLAILASQTVPDELDSKRLTPWEFVLAVPKKWKKRKLTQIIKEERLCTYHEDDQTAFNYLKTFNFEKHMGLRKIHVNDNNAKRNLIEHGVCYGVLPKEFIENHSSSKLHIVDKRQIYKIPLSIAWYKRKSMPTYLSDLIKAVK